MSARGGTGENGDQGISHLIAKGNTTTTKASLTMGHQPCGHRIPWIVVAFFGGRGLDQLRQPSGKQANKNHICKQIDVQHST